MLRLNVSAVVRCDKCGAEKQMPYHTKITMIKEIRKYGWAVGKKCLCPNCRETPKSRHKGFFRKRYRI